MTRYDEVLALVQGWECWDVGTSFELDADGARAAIAAIRWCLGEINRLAAERDSALEALDEQHAGTDAVWNEKDEVMRQRDVALDRVAALESDARARMRPERIRPGIRYDEEDE